MIVKMLHDVWKEEVLSYRYGKHVAIAVLVAAVSFGGYQAYAWNKFKHEQAAQFALAEAIEELDKACFYLLDPKEQNKQLAEQYFKDAQLAFEVVKSSHSSSDLLPYALGFEADIALRQGDAAKAIQLLDQSIKAMSSKNKLYGMMNIKRALVRIDAGDESTGVAELEKFAADKNNAHADTAAFYLGYYYFSANNVADAVRVWTVLRDSMKNVTTKSGRSPWLSIVEEKLQQLGA